MKTILITKNAPFFNKGDFISKNIEIVDIVAPGESAIKSINNNSAQFVFVDKDTALELNDSFAKSIDVYDEDDFVFSSTRKGIKKISIKEIIYFKAEDKYVIAYSARGELLINLTLKYLIEKYESKFLRIHRKYLVSLTQVKELTKDVDGQYYLLLKSLDKKLPVSRRKLSKIRKILLGKL